jgi:hypothetical protein
MAPAAGLLLRPAANSSHSSACERAIRAASRARPATRRSCPASSFRFACSCLSACASASAALCSRVTAVRLSTDAGCAARTRVSRPTRSAAALGGSTASESIAPTIMASLSGWPAPEFAGASRAPRSRSRREASGPGRPTVRRRVGVGTQAHGDHVVSGRCRPCSSMVAVAGGKSEIVEPRDLLRSELDAVGSLGSFGGSGSSRRVFVDVNRLRDLTGRSGLRAAMSPATPHLWIVSAGLGWREAGWQLCFRVP